MQLRKDERARLAQEIRYVVEKMREDSDPFDQIYFFSAVCGAVGRLLNDTWDPELALVHQITQAAHGAINNRLVNVTTGRERGIMLPENLLDVLTSITAELADIVLQERDSELLRVLARLAELTYVTTGNGYYLYLKGKVRL